MSTLDVKTCTRCREAKEVDAFYVYKRAVGRAGKLHAACKECEKKKTRAYVAAEPEKRIAAVLRWQTKNPELVKEYKRRSYAKNPELYKAKVIAYQAEHKEQCRNYKRKNRAMRRAQERNTRVDDIASADIAKVFAAFDGWCAWCDHRDATTLDHVVPLSRGGSHVLNNLLPSCVSCNSSKNARDPHMFAARVGKDLQALLARVHATLLTV